MNTELDYIDNMIRSARGPEDIFGALSDTREKQEKELEKMFKNLRKVIHPDRHLKSEQDFRKANDLFIELQNIKEKAEAKIKNGTYGASKKTAKNSGSKSKKGSPGTSSTGHSGTSSQDSSRTSSSKSGSAKSNSSKTGRPGSSAGSANSAKKYNISFQKLVYYGSIYNLYDARIKLKTQTNNVWVKICNDPSNNDVMENETHNLRTLCGLCRGKDRIYATHYLPKYIDSYVLNGDDGKPRHMVLLERLSGYYTIESILQKFPHGIDPQAAASLVNRLLEILGFIHKHSYVNGAVLPGNIMVNPENNLLVVMDWTASLKKDGKDYIHLKDDNYPEEYYPSNARMGEPAHGGIDTYMAVMCGIALTGGDVTKGTAGPNTPQMMKQFLETIISSGQASESLAAWNVRADFEKVQKSVFSRPAFQPFGLKGAA